MRDFNISSCLVILIKLSIAAEIAYFSSICSIEMHPVILGFNKDVINTDSIDCYTRHIIATDDTIADDLDLKLRSARAISIINSELTPRERQIITLRYGIGGRSAITQREVAAKMGISRSYVSRIEGTALKKISEGLERFSF